MREQCTKRVLVTGGAGFISSNFIRHLLEATPYEVVIARRAHLRGQPREPRRRDDATSGSRSCTATSATPRSSRELVGGVDVIVNAAAESHVEKSIETARRSS